MKSKLVLTFALFVLNSAYGQHYVITLDSYFNNEHRLNKLGLQESYHYKWTEKDEGGFSAFGEILKKQGAVIKTLYQEPTSKNLSNSNVYIIVDPDTKTENPNAHFILSKYVAVIENWVKKGGILLLLANDKNNVELPHLNRLATVFGIHFNNDLILHVINDQGFIDGSVLTKGNAIFKSGKKIFIKDACSLSLSKSSRPILSKQHKVIMAAASYGQGQVIAVGDPWIYNEYMNGRLPVDFDNRTAASDFTKWLLHL